MSLITFPEKHVSSSKLSIHHPINEAMNLDPVQRSSRETKGKFTKIRFLDDIILISVNNNSPALLRQHIETSTFTVEIPHVDDPNVNLAKSKY